MSYQALYRKWRPSGFDGLVGQDAVVTTLKNQIRSDRIGHAYLFCGTRGTGKTSAAKIFARAVNCPNAKEYDGSPCNECETCHAINSGRAMNVFEIDAASNNGVDNIRDIREQVEYPPVTGRYKVYIIDEVHMLSAGAFNALLKTLEEPPAYVIFILATTDPQKIPATILSRCQRYDFRRMSRAVIAGHLKEIIDKEGVRAEEKALNYIAEAADGSMRDSLSILDQCLAYHYGDILSYDNVLSILGASDDSAYSALFGQIVSHNVEAALETVAALVNNGCEPSRIINDFIMYLRNVLLVKSLGSKTAAELSEERYRQAEADAQKTDRDGIIAVIAAMAELSNRIRFSAQKRVGLEVELIRLCTANVRTAAQQTQSISTLTADRQVPSAASLQSARIHINIADPAAHKHTEQPAAAAEPKATAVSEKTVAQSKAEDGITDAPGGLNETAGGNEVQETGSAGYFDRTAVNDIYSMVRNNWNILLSGLSAANRPLFSRVLLREEHGNIVLVFKNKMNYRLAALNQDENGVVRLRELAVEKLGIKVNFIARVAKPGEFSDEIPRATNEELAKIKFPISIED